MSARAPLVVRADGRGFKKVLEKSTKPYDIDFARSMVSTSEKFLLDFGPSAVLAFTFSDEISLVFLDLPFAGRVEKIDSLVAGFLSAALSLELRRLVSMDCRTIPLCQEEIISYLAERQDETWRNHVFSYGFHMLLEEGLNETQAMDRLRGLREKEIHEFVFQKGINLARTPAWQRRGVVVCRKEGKVAADWDVPLFSTKDGMEFLREIIGPPKTGTRNRPLIDDKSRL